MTTQRYQEASIHLLDQAESELAAGDMRQASEKGWGAAAQAVKAVCEERGWEHQSHRSLYRAVARLVRESDDSTIRAAFQIANDLHTNFYEDREEAELIAGALIDIRRFVEKLSALP